MPTNHEQQIPEGYQVAETLTWPDFQRKYTVKENSRAGTKIPILGASGNVVEVVLEETLKINSTVSHFRAATLNILDQTGKYRYSWKGDAASSAEYYFEKEGIDEDHITVLKAA